MKQNKCMIGNVLFWSWNKGEKKDLVIFFNVLVIISCLNGYIWMLYFSNHFTCVRSNLSFSLFFYKVCILTKRTKHSKGENPSMFRKADKTQLS
jgi:hypothetical protein